MALVGSGSSGAVVEKDLVLLGGGHSHLEVLRSFGMRPMKGVKLTLITRDVHTPYSGMLPGYVSGFYDYDDCHIDLSRLALYARASLIHAEATGIDTVDKSVLLAGRPPVRYDVLSINLGITPGKSSVPGAAEYTTAVKPIDRFVAAFQSLLARYQEAASPLHVVVVGGGAGGVELCLAVHYRLNQKQSNIAEGDPKGRPRVTLVSRGKILPDHPPAARQAFLKIMQDKGIVMVEKGPVVEVRPKEIVIDMGVGKQELLPFDECLWCTQASAAPWLRGTGLPTDPNGFLLVDEFLRSHGGPPEVFAVGDVATSVKYPRPKAGVFAVRQGPAVAENLRRFLSSQPLLPFVPQSTYLSLITAGGKDCVGTKGGWTLEGSWLWWVKDHIDRSFMYKYGRDIDLTKTMGMADGRATMQHTTDPTGLTAMRCGGCGSKVGASILGHVLKKLREDEEVAASSQHVCAPIELKDMELPLEAVPPGLPPSTILLGGLVSPDDAAVLSPPPSGHLVVQTVDFFKTFWNDPFLLGKIAAVHAMSDCYAMGGQPRSALATVILPLGSDQQMQQHLYQVMSGAMRALSEGDCQLVGGHTSEGDELAIGFSISGDVAPPELMTKSGLRPGQLLVLTKALGTGTLMAGAMRGATLGRHIMRALRDMQVSNRQAAQILRKYGCTGCTDVTGFGLLGHLQEMTEASKVCVSLQLSSLPHLPGAQDTLLQGVLSSLHPKNMQAVHALHPDKFTGDWRLDLLVDPQTSGGLLAGVDEEHGDQCVQELRLAGYGDAAIVGRVLERLEGQDQKDAAGRVVLE